MALPERGGSPETPARGSPARGRLTGAASGAAALALLHLGLALLTFVPTPHVGGDNAVYVSLARALLEHAAYVDLWDPALPPHTQFPPVFPLLLALAMLSGLRDWVGLKLLVVAVSAAAVALSYLWLRRTTTAGVALAVGLLLAASPGLLAANHWVLSDIPFWAFTALALLAFTHLGGSSTVNTSSDRPVPDPGNGRGWVALAVGAVALAYFTRAAGLPLVLAAALYLVLQRRWRALLLLAATVGLLAGLWRSWTAQGERSYLSHIWSVDPYQPSLGEIGVLGLFPRVLENLGRYLAWLLPDLVLGSRGWAAVALVGVLVAAALAGWVRRLRRPGVAELFLPLYAGLLAVWPATWASDRYLIPLLPLVLLYAAEAVRDLTERFPHRAAVRGLACGLLLLAVTPALARQAVTGTGCTAEYLAGEPFPCLEPIWYNFLHVAHDSRGRLPEGSVVLSRKPALFFALSGYRSRLYPMSSEPEQFLQAAAEAGARYVVVDQVPGLATLYLHPVLLARQHQFCVVPELHREEASMVGIDAAAPRRPAGGPPNAFRACPVDAAAASIAGY